MNNDLKFTWSRMSLCFPEWSKDMTKGEFDSYFPESPEFTNEQVSFRFKEKYGIQMYFNQKIEPWLEKAPEETRNVLLKMHSDLSHKVHDEVIKELDDSFDIFESWRKFVSKHNGYEWVGNLQNHLDFNNKGDIVTLWDYYKFYLNYDSKRNSPTSVINKIQKLPEDSLNDKWKKYLELHKNISEDEIIGKTLTECIKNADEIYKLAPELKELKF